MFWCGWYLGIAVIVGAAVFVLANFVRPVDVVAPDSPGVLSALAGALWPVLVFGVTELALAAWLIPGHRTD